MFNENKLLDLYNFQNLNLFWQLSFCLKKMWKSAKIWSKFECIGRIPEPKPNEIVGIGHKPNSAFTTILYFSYFSSLICLVFI